MEFNTIDNILDFAISREREAADFYRQLSDRESFADQKEMFWEFASEEKKHEGLLQKLKDGLVDTELEDYEWKWIIDIKRSNYTDQIVYRPGMPYNEILLLAAKREEKALALYNECLAGADNEDVKRVFKMLCQEEAKHKLALEDMLDQFMAEMGD